MLTKKLIIQVTSMDGGRYVHFEWVENMSKYLNNLEPPPHDISIDFHIDGVDITNEHSLGLWTILCKKLGFS